MDVNAVTFLGHASTIIQLGGLTVYTDPHFSRRALGVRRRHPPPNPMQLPKPDAVVLSHAHYDHLDFHTFKYIPATTPIIIPYGLKGLLARLLPHPLVELKPGSTFLLQGRVTIEAVPVKHRGGRLSHLRYTASSAYLLSSAEGTVFFAGDTAYYPPLRQLGERHVIDVALLPIGPCYPRWFMKRRHLNPEEALRLFAEMGAHYMIPIHWGTFRLGLEGAETPLYWLKSCLDQFERKEQVVILRPGERWDLRRLTDDSA